MTREWASKEMTRGDASDGLVSGLVQSTIVSEEITGPNCFIFCIEVLFNSFFNLSKAIFDILPHSDFFPIITIPTLLLYKLGLGGIYKIASLN